MTVMVELRGEAADWVEAIAWQISKHSEVGTLRSVAVAIDSTGVKFKINEGVWSPGHGVVVTVAEDDEISEEEERAWNQWP